jgi:hypothetical protein
MNLVLMNESERRKDKNEMNGECKSNLNYESKLAMMNDSKEIS